jgi:hypothetical protein
MHKETGGERRSTTTATCGKQHHIGTFGTKEEAALAYDRATREHGGSRSPLNYVST